MAELSPVDRLCATRVCVSPSASPLAVDDQTKTAASLRYRPVHRLFASVCPCTRFLALLGPVLGPSFD